MRLRLRTCACACICVCVCMCISAGIPDCPASDQSGTGMKKSNNAGTYPVLDKADAFQHTLVRYRTEIMDAGMPMPALVSSMLMPSYGNINLKSAFLL